jgi:hypothetical protein
MDTMESIRKELVFEIEKAVRNTINELAKRYNLNEREASNYIMRERKIPLPYLGEIKEIWCDGMKEFEGLYTQCRNVKVLNSPYCVWCGAEARKYGKPLGGEIKDRKKWEKEKDGSGNALVSYISVLEKCGISREEAEAEALKYGITIPEEYFEKKSTVKRGRPKKGKQEEEKEKGPRGRPPKEEKVITNHVGDDLISRLLEQAKKNEKR